MKQKTKSILLIATLCLSLACISRIYGETQYDVFIYVDLSITGIQDSLNQYRDDLENEGWSCFQRNVTSEDMSKDASFFRSDLAYFHSLFNIKGAIFVGDFPSANWKNGYLTDYYYMDLDGNWYDTNNDTAYDVHNGTIGPEIWVGRLMASTIVHWHWEYPLNETELVNDYFAKNHQYRNASSRAESTRPRALAYIDNQFAYGGDIRNESGYGYNPVFVNDTVSCFEKAYADVALVADPIANGTNTNANAYMNSLKNTDGYEWTWVFDHGRTEEHGFAKYFWNETSEVWQAPLMPNEGSVGDHYYQTDTPKTFFYIFSSCSAAKFSEDNCVANVAIFGEGKALASIGMTEDGSFPASWFFEAFDQLGQHRCIGEAFKALYNSTINYYDGAKAYKRLILLGDPTIKTNSPPYAPSQLSGQESGYLEVPYDYSANTTDLNGDQISYQFNWDDGTNTITEWHNSGETGNASHAWSCPGTYSVKVRAKDNYTTWSDWSQPFNVTIDERIRYMQSVKWPNSTYWKLFWNNTSTSASQVGIL